MINSIFLIFKHLFKVFGFDLQIINLKKINPIQPWMTDLDFLDIYKEIKDRTLVKPARAFFVYQIAKNLGLVDGCIAEVGVYRGGMLKFLGLIDRKSEIYGFDTFEGMPKVNKKEDLHKEGDFSTTSFEEVKNFLYGIPHISLHKGFFPESAGPVIDKNFKLVHIDVDIYQSVKDSVDFFYSRMSNGGVIIFDDYGFLTCPGARKAVDEFFCDKKEKPIYIPTGQCFIIKQ